MLIRTPRAWELPEHRATPERFMLDRRAALAGAGALATFGLTRRAAAQDAAPRNPAYDGGRAITPERDATTYNNFYEFGTSKNIVQPAQRLPLRPWTVKLDGMVARPQEIAIDDLLRRIPQEERVYRHRCVEGWSMVVPWTGFQLSELLKLAQPTAAARYVQFETAALPAVMPGLRQTWYPWPYTEGLALDEARNELAFVATGLYGRPLLPQNGAPIRVVLPWKYGFKSGKSLARITLTDRRPTTYWEALGPDEYGFWANVNPAVPHPRWSQATERVLGSNDRVPTQIYNGYGSTVAGLYANRQSEALFK